MKYFFLLFSGTNRNSFVSENSKNPCILLKQETKWNETKQKRNETKQKRNETKRNETKRNETKRNYFVPENSNKGRAILKQETKRNETKRNGTISFLKIAIRVVQY